MYDSVNNYVPPPLGWAGGGGGGERNIVFSADRVGVGIGVATCLHSISLLNWQILAKLTQIHKYIIGRGKCWLVFGEFDPIFKVTGGLRSLENGA